MSTPTVRCAIVGLVQGLEDVYTTLNHPRYTVVALCDTSPQVKRWLTGEEDIDDAGPEAAVFQHHKDWVKSSRSMPEFEAVEFIDSFDDVLAREDIDAVILVLPDVLHAPFAIKALKAGKYVLSTKPMARTPEEAFEIAEVARANPNHYMLGFQLSYSKFAQEVMAIIDSGEIGTIRQIRFDYHRGPWRPVHRRKYSDVDGAMIKEGVHWLDLIYRLSGELAWKAMAGFGGRDTFPDDFEFEDNGVLLIDFEGFRAAHTFTYYRRSSQPEDFLLVGEKGLIRGTFERFEVQTEAGTREVEVPGMLLPKQHHVGYYEMHDAFAAMCLDDTTPYTNWQTALENMLSCYAAQIAIADGRTVQRSEFADIDWRVKYPVA
ncbi:MAG: Gfo/Idh/MocA family oxidoreductase [Microbacterium sp.]